MYILCHHNQNNQPPRLVYLDINVATNISPARSLTHSPIRLIFDPILPRFLSSYQPFFPTFTQTFRTLPSFLDIGSVPRFHSSLTKLLLRHTVPVPVPTLPCFLLFPLRILYYYDLSSIMFLA